MNSTIGLFEAYGIEIELMIVDRDTLAVRPLSDKLLTDAHGSLVSDFEDGDITWSNELVSHVVEFKTTHPAPSLEGLEESFHKSQLRATALLANHNCRLMPTGMHPWMNPHSETVLWPHDNNEIYALYNSIFDCRGHGWSNLQSVHLNLPFKSESEFKRLHSAIRLILPILPALSASTPIADSMHTGIKDTRLSYYESNQLRLPIIAGEIVPDPIASFAEYRARISDPIQKAIRPFDNDGLLQGDWLNSRGAIARIDRGTIEIRLLDTQECTHADLTIVQLIVATLKSLIADEQTLEAADNLNTRSLYQVWKACVIDAETAIIDDPAYSRTLIGSDSSNTSSTARSLWQNLFDSRVRSSLPPNLINEFENLLSRPSLASRILYASGANPSKKALHNIYETLCNCLDKNELFDPHLVTSRDNSQSDATRVKIDRTANREASV